jgi:hypothetical protein
MKKNEQLFTNNSRRLAAPISGFLSGKCCAALIVFRGIGAASFLLV